MKVLLGHHGLRGDLALNIPAIEHAKKVAGWTIDMPINKQFLDLLPIFVNQPSFNPVITDNYETFSSPSDKILVKARGYGNVFNPMQPHRDDWYNHRHQTSTVLFDYFGQELPLDSLQINLSRWFDVTKESNCIAFAPFAGWSHEKKSDKMLTVENAQKIADAINKMGYSVVQIGGPDEPRLEGTAFFLGSYFESVKVVLGCRLLLHTDTGMGWITSGYKHPQIGLYGHRYYGEANVKNIQPVNPNGIYLDSATVNDISLDSIVQTLKTILGKPHG